MKKFLGALDETFLGRREFLADKLGKLLEFFALLGGEFLRHGDVESRHEVAASAVVEDGHPLPSQFENSAALRASRDFQFGGPFERGHVDFTAKCGGGKADGHFAIKVLAVALENIVFLDVDDDVEIATRTATDAGLAVAGDAEARAVVNAGGDFNFDAARQLGATFATAFGARALDRLAGATAARAGL